MDSVQEEASNRSEAITRCEDRRPGSQGMIPRDNGIVKVWS